MAHSHKHFDGILHFDTHTHNTNVGRDSLPAWRKAQIAGEPAPIDGPPISDQEIADIVEGKLLPYQQKHRIIAANISGRASAVAPHQGNAAQNKHYTRIINDLTIRMVAAYPKNFVGIGHPAQTPGGSLETTIAEIRRCVDMGFVGFNINPDPSGGQWSDPPLTDEKWYPLYETACELNIPLTVHVSGSCNEHMHDTTGTLYLNNDTRAAIQLLTQPGNLFERFPDLKFVVPHGGGALAGQFGRIRGIAATKMAAKTPGWCDPRTYLGKNVFLDTCIYSPDDMLNFMKQFGASAIGGSEYFGAAQGDDPDTGRAFDDTVGHSLIAAQALGWDRGELQKLWLGRALEVWPRLGPQAEKQGMDLVIA